jgi:hypothetical protein
LACFFVVEGLIKKIFGINIFSYFRDGIQISDFEGFNQRTVNINDLVEAGNRGVDKLKFNTIHFCIQTQGIHNDVEEFNISHVMLFH